MGEGPQTAQGLRLKQGTSAVATGLAGVLPEGSVFLNSAVTDTAQSDGGCTVTTIGCASIKSRKVVPAILTNTYSNIAFSLPLPEDRQDIVSRTEAGIYIKAMLTYAKPWWQSLGLIGQLYILEGPLEFSGRLPTPRSDTTPSPSSSTGMQRRTSGGYLRRSRSRLC